MSIDACISADISRARAILLDIRKRAGFRERSTKVSRARFRANTLAAHSFVHTSEKEREREQANKTIYPPPSLLFPFIDATRRRCAVPPWDSAGSIGVCARNQSRFRRRRVRAAVAAAAAFPHAKVTRDILRAPPAVPLNYRAIR